MYWTDFHVTLKFSCIFKYSRYFLLTCLQLMTESIIFFKNNLGNAKSDEAEMNL